MFCLLHRYMENAFSWWLGSVTAEHLRNYAELAEDQAGRPIGCWRERGEVMATEPPTPSAEQLAEWQALVERVRQGDRSLGVPRFDGQG
jgi:2,4-dienoyl-CoA reductase-like NADH-dependent reductase (Old Yellow Enzyme family)